MNDTFRFPFKSRFGNELNDETEAGFLKSLKEAFIIGLSLVAIVISTTPDDISGNGQVATARPGQFVLLEEPNEVPKTEVISKDWSVQLLEVETSLEAAFEARRKLAVKSSIKVVSNEDSPPR